MERVIENLDYIKSTDTLSDELRQRAAKVTLSIVSFNSDCAKLSMINKNQISYYGDIQFETAFFREEICPLLTEKHNLEQRVKRYYERIIELEAE